MPKTSTSRVTAHRARKREQGYKLFQAWLTPKEEKAIKQFLQQMREEK